MIRAVVAKIVVGMKANVDDRIRKVAALLIVRYGERAAGHAALQAFKARQRWEPDREYLWESIAAVIIQALRAEKRSPEGRAGALRLNFRG